MEPIKSTKIVKKRNTSGQLLSLLAFLSILPLYGLYFYLPFTKTDSPAYRNFQQDFDAANSLSRATMYLESNQALWSLFSRNIEDEKKLTVLELIRRNSRKSNQLGELLKVLYLIQAHDPKEEYVKYQKELFDTLKKLGRDKDASLYLQAKSGLKKQSVTSGSSQLVIANIGNEEVYQADLEQFINENPQFEDKKSEGLVQLIIRRILKRKSLFILEDTDFLKKLDLFSEEMRITEFLKRELSTHKPTDLELRSYFEANKSDYNHPAGVRLVHLLLFEKDEQVLQKIETMPPASQEQFKELVVDFSRSLNKIRSGILPDWITGDNLPTEGNFEGLWEFLRNCSLGLNGPFRSRRGVHYFWIFDKRDATINTYEQVLDKLNKKYTSERSKQIQEQYFKGLIRDQQVQIFHERM